MSPFVPGYAHFLTAASRLRWVEREIDLTADAGHWPHLDPARRERIAAFVAAFLLAERRVAIDLAPFIAAAPSDSLADCFRAQAVDEERHARFFERYELEVLGGEAPAPDPAFAELFEHRLRAIAAALGERRLPLSDAVGLYHLVLEGVVFGAGQSALLSVLEQEPGLPGLRAGLERVIADERWHVGLGVSVLRESGFEDQSGERLILAGEEAAGAWGALLGSERREAAIEAHRRRLAVAGLGRAQAQTSPA